jgi:hypothetical protein
MSSPSFQGASHDWIKLFARLPVAQVLAAAAESTPASFVAIFLVECECCIATAHVVNQIAAVVISKNLISR